MENGKLREPKCSTLNRNRQTKRNKADSVDVPNNKTEACVNMYININNVKFTTKNVQDSVNKYIRARWYVRQDNPAKSKQTNRAGINN